jgi:hypothetical protein
MGKRSKPQYDESRAIDKIILAGKVAGFKAPMNTDSSVASNAYKKKLNKNTNPS